MSSFAIRSAVQSAALVVPAVLTFVCAGTIYFWQGWLFWLTFGACTVATGIYVRLRDPALLERRMRVGPIAESRPLEKAIAAAMLAVFFALAVVSGLDRRWGWSQLPAAVVIIANILVIACFGVFIAVLRENTFAASTVTVEAGQRVISTGLYAYVRHPMYSGGVLLLFAMPLAMGSGWGLAISILAIPLLIARIADEERSLSAELAGYDDYRRAVRYRLIPRLW